MTRVIFLWAAFIVADICAQLLMKSAALAAAKPRGLINWLVALLLQWRVWVAVGCLIMAFAAWMFILRDGRLSTTFPVTSLTLVGILIGSHYLFGESLSLIHYAGVALIVAGIVLLRGKSSDA